MILLRQWYWDSVGIRLGWVKMNRFFDVDVLLSLFESMHIGIIFVDPDGIIRYCNVPAGMMKNIRKEALVGRKLPP